MSTPNKTSARRKKASRSVLYSVLLLMLVSAIGSGLLGTAQMQTGKKLGISKQGPGRVSQVDASMTKEEKHARMRDLQSQIASVKGTQGSAPGELDALNSELNDISESMGGDLPANEPDAGSSFRVGKIKAPLPHVIAPLAGCTITTTSFTQSTPTPIPTGPAVVSSTVLVAGAGTYLWDADLTTALTHTFAADLDITIASPAGTVVTLTTDNGAGNDDVFNGTLWDDQANPAGQVPYVTNAGMATDHPYVNLILASPLVPEESMSAFRGEDPNGTWTITISDDLAGDGGSLASWTLDLGTLAAAPTTATTSATQSTPTAIPTGPAVVSSTLLVAGAGTALSDLNLTTAITHTFAADLDITLASPAGTVVTLTTDNGAGNDNTWNGTLWDDFANPAGQVPYVTNAGLVTDHPYVNLTLASPLVVEESMGAFSGENPNGTWTITISDDLAGDGGSLDSWTLDVTTATCAVCMITCPANVSQSNDPNQCGAVVNYAAPTTSGPCGAVVCSPASGSFFPVGTTTVTCTAGVAPSCTFTVTVNDTQPPSITCPPNQNAVAAANDPGAVVTFPPPTASDNCPGVTVACLPASGSTFPVGTSTVSCTATDASGNTATCSFNVNVSCTADPTLANLDPLIISRFRENGPGGATDEYVEIHNPLSEEHVVASGNCTGGISVFASAGNGTTSNAVTQVCFIPNGTVIPAGGYFLCTGTGYTLDQLGRNSGPAGATSTGDAPIGCGGSCVGNIPNDAGLAILDVGANIVVACTKGAFGCPTGFNYSSPVSSGNAFVYDSVGFSAYLPGAPAPARPSLADNYCEGPCLLPVGDMRTSPTCTNPTGLFPVVADGPACYGQAGQYGLLRRQTTFVAGTGTTHQDSNNNPADFLVVAPNGAVNMGLALTGVSGVTSIHGAAAPKNTSAPSDRDMSQAPFDGPGTNQLGPRNAERNYNQDPQVANTANDPLGTFTLRLQYSTGGAPVSGLRFSMDDISTLCGSQGALTTGTASARNLAAAPDCQGGNLFTAIGKVLNSTSEVVVDSSNTARLVFGTVMQDLSVSAVPTPVGSGAHQPLGGGVDSMLVLNPDSTPPSVGDGVTGGTGAFTAIIPASTTIRVKFKFGVVRGGRFIVLIQPMASPSP